MARPTSAFLSLPQELRDQIYEYLLTTTFRVRNPSTYWELSRCLRLHPDTHLAILSVSKSTYEEGKRSLYRNGHFCFNNCWIGGPRLYEVIGYIPAIRLLQHITIRIGTGAIVLEEPMFEEMARRLINSFADLGSDFGVPRERCVVEIELFNATIPRSFNTYITAADLTDALGRLMGFKTVEVTVEYSRLHVRPRSAEELVEPLLNALDGRLTAKLGEVETGHYNQRIYHPHRG